MAKDKTVTEFTGIITQEMMFIWLICLKKVVGKHFIGLYVRVY